MLMEAQNVSETLAYNTAVTRLLLLGGKFWCGDYLEVQIWCGRELACVVLLCA
jgi:hypothetical protein